MIYLKVLSIFLILDLQGKISMLIACVCVYLCVGVCVWVGSIASLLVSLGIYLQKLTYRVKTYKNLGKGPYKQDDIHKSKSLILLLVHNLACEVKYFNLLFNSINLIIYFSVWLNCMEIHYIFTQVMCIYREKLHKSLTNIWQKIVQLASYS